MIKMFYLIFLFILIIWGNFSFAQYEHIERIISFDSEITISEDASMIVIEKIRVYAAGQKIQRGIYRDFPTEYKDQYGNNVNIKFDVLEVSRDGNSEEYHTENLSNGIRLYFGRSDYFLPVGEYTYSIKYKTNLQIGYFEKFDELYWNVTGNGWDFLIEKVTATVNLPAPVSSDDLKLYAYTGYSGYKGSDYDYEIISSDKVVFNSTNMLNPNEGLTISIQWPKGLVYEPTQTERVGYFIQDNIQIVFGLVGIVALIFYYLIIWMRVGKDPAKGLIIPLYEPPNNMSPASVRFVSEMGYDNKIFTSTIVSLAVKGYLKIEEEGSEYRLIKVIGSKKSLSNDEQAVFYKLGFKNDGGRQVLELEQKNHSILRGAIKALKSSLKNSYESNYFLTNKKYFFIGLAISILILLISIIGGSGEQVFILIWISFWSIGVAALMFAVFNAWKGSLSKGRGKVTALGGAIFLTLFSIPFVIGEIVGFYFLAEVSSPLMIFVIAIIALVNIVFYNLLKAPTLLGRKIMDKIDGFKMYLGVAEKDRLYSVKEPDRTPELFESFLPYALALNVENQWAERFSNILSSLETDSTAYKPGWYSGTIWSTLGAAGFASSLSGSLSSTISSSSTAPGSSSGGGGGGSSGGGGGGG
ncbi:MAG: DUF2207 domain-containing protein, partial [Ignavibacteriaceae bacterium]|nr:DUF2207 domain-containing protein [Ignavibacteriaceae bacterium]